MALGDVIARLAISLQLETAALEKGATLAEKRFEQSRKRFESIGKKMQSVGIKMSAAITAPLAGLGYMLARNAKQLVETSREMRIASQVAGDSFENFQRLAFGAKTVGIEADKLGDIFKDVQDKVGDFRATGGGGMADFFENIAPKVNVTAEAFKNLSGKDALQLYYDSLVKAGVSSDEMRFYLEAIASDTTMLIPLLENGGKAFDEFGKSAAVISEADAKGLEEYAVASQKMEAAMQKLTIAIVGSGLLEAVTGLVTKATEWIGWLAELNPEILNWALGIGAVAAALGPVILGIGTAVKVGAGFLAFLTNLGPVLSVVSKALLLLAANPVLLAFAAVIAGIYLAWKNWDKIEPIIIRLYVAVTKWVLDKLGAVWDKVKKKIDFVKGLFFGLYDAVVGNSYIPDMVDGIAAEMARLDSVMVDPARKAAEKTADVFRNLAQEARGILDRLFPEAAARLEYDRERSVLKAAGSSEAALRALARERDDERRTSMVGVDFGGRGGPLDEGLNNLDRQLDKLAGRAKVTTVRIAKSFKDMADDTLSSLNRLTSAIKGGGFLGILEGIIGLGMQLGSIGAFGKTIAGRLNNVPGYANGTSFHSGGLAVVGERGPELVSMPRGSSVTPNNKMGGMTNVQIVPSPYFDAVVDGRVLSAAPAIAQAGGQVGMQRAAYSNSRRWR